tara:strand:- start:1145 stop:1543 length:399 start_codon:yes stop_codon:yes gene_type:complete
MYGEIFMYKIYMKDPDNSSQYLEFLTHDSSEALDILLENRKRLVEKDYKWITNYVSIILPTNDVYEAMRVFLQSREKIVDQDIILSGGKCLIRSLGNKYSDSSIKPKNILESMKTKNSAIRTLINQLKLEVV